MSIVRIIKLKSFRDRFTNRYGLYVPEASAANIQHVEPVEFQPYHTTAQYSYYIEPPKHRFVGGSVPIMSGYDYILIIGKRNFYFKSPKTIYRNALACLKKFNRSFREWEENNDF